MQGDTQCVRTAGASTGLANSVSIADMGISQSGTVKRDASRAKIVAAAMEELDSLPDWSGEVGLTAVAKRVGIAPPSLYKHVSSAADLHRGIATECVRELREVVTDAVLGRSGADALQSLIRSTRGYALEHPGRYAATQRAANRADPADADLAVESDRLVHVIAASLAEYALSDEGMLDAIRVVRAATHGFIMLEMRGGFGLPNSVEHTFDTMITLLIDGIDALREREPEAPPEGRDA